jgi:signal transduction histidine kinase
MIAFLGKLSVRHKLLGALALDLLLLLGLGAFAWRNLGFMKEKAERVEKNTIPSLRSVDEIGHLQTRYRSLQLEYLIHANAADRERLEKELLAVEDQVARGLERQRALLGSPAELPAGFSAMTAAWSAYAEAHHQRFLPAARRANTGTVQPALSRLNPLYQDLLAATRQFAHESELEATAAFDAVAATYHGSRQVIVVATIASLLVSAAIGFVLAEAAHRAQQEAQAASAAKSRFLATMSHELRTPLNAMLGYAQLLQLEARARGLEAIGEDLERLVGAGRHLTTVIDNVLDFSKIEQGKVDILVEEVELDQLLWEVADLVAPSAAQRGNRLEVVQEGPLGILPTDPAKLRQILFNLLSNAVKFTAGGSIVLRARRAEAAGGGVELAVEDSGIGIAEEHQQLIFQPFEQADGSITRRFGGTGLGLVVSRQLAEMLGGSLTVTSRPGVGSTFQVVLPSAAKTANIPR